MKRVAIPSAVAAAFLVLLSCGGGPPPEPVIKPIDYASIRGTNYVPTYASTSIAIWKNFDTELIDRELGHAARLNLNSVRIFLQYVVYEHSPQEFLERLDTFLKIASRHGLSTMVVFFDSCFGEEPAYDKDQSPLWLNNPGFSRLDEEDWPALEKYVSDVVNAHKDDPRVAIWDIMNEPMADLKHVTEPERETIWKFVRHFCSYVKQLDPEHPITVGHAVVEFIPKTIDLVDVASIHSYLPTVEWLRDDIRLAKGYAQQAGKPVIVTEFGNPAAGQTYEMGLDVIEEEKLGFYLWELMIGKMQFKNQQGLVYADGAIRRAEPIARLLGFKLDAERIPLNAPVDHSEAISLLGDRARWPAYVAESRRAGTQKEIMPRLQVLGMMGRLAARPSDDARRAFEMILAIPQLFRMEREQEALETYKQLLDLLDRVVPGGAASSGD